MNCEWAEGYLSAYLDDALDPQARQDVGSHVEQCAECNALLEDYRRLDHVLATATRVAPPDELHARIFDSPAFAAIVRDQQRQSQRPARARIINVAAHTPRLRREGRALHRSAQRHGEPTMTPVTPIGASSSPPTIQTPQHTRRTAVVWAGVLAPVAAVVLLALGATLLFRQGLLPFQGTSSGRGTTTTIGGYNPTGAPLAAGPRLVFAHDGALWSAPQHGPAADGLPGAAQRLTPTSAHVISWQAAPAANGAHATLIAYIDGNTGALHLVRSDSQDDHAIGSVTATAGAAFWASAAGHATLAGLTWSPDGTQLAYLHAAANGAISLHVMHADGSHDTVVDTGTHGQPSAAVWSADGHWLAFTQTTSAGQQHVNAYTVGAAPVTLAAQADPFNPQARVMQMAWLSGSAATLTWATGDGRSLTGVFVAAAQGATGQSTRLTPVPDRFAAADFSSARNAWLVAGPNTLITITQLTTQAPQLTPVATLDAPARLISWSPTGQSAAVLSGATLEIWSPASGLASVTRGVAASPAPIWSANGASLAYVAGSTVVNAILQQGHVTTLETLARAPIAYVLRWSPDGQVLGIAIPSGVLLTPADGSHIVLVDTHAADNSALAWSIAG
ncbi:MAG: zf-HC2 domain-containing protein [Ktedonobacterales bacterium]